jgi:hypothetical protein
VRKFFILIFTLFIYLTSFSQSAITNLNKTKFEIGDQIVYSFSLPIEKSNEIGIYLPKEIKDSLEIIGQTIDTIERQGKKYLDIRCYFTSFVAGKHKIINPNGRVLDFEVMPFPIDTLKIEIKDIKANSKEPFTISEIMPIIIWVLVATALLIGSYFGYKLWKKYRKVKIKEIFIKPKPKLPADIIALNSLEELRLKRLIENGRTKEYYSEISEIIREYLYNRFEISAMEMTTEEILREVKRYSDINNNSYLLLEYILKNSDLVKFAKFFPDSYISDKCMKDANEFVNQTKLIVQTQEKEEEND